MGLYMPPRVWVVSPAWRMFALLTVSLLLGGCAQYVTPGGPANFARMEVHGLGGTTRANLTNHNVEQALKVRPLAQFPTAIAVARLQASGYRNDRYAPAQVAGAPFTLITNGKTAKGSDLREISDLPQITGVVPLNRMLVGAHPRSYLALRVAAARLHADMLLLYTFDTRFHTKSRVPALGLITLGLFPERNAKVTCAATAILMDVRDGYIYGAFQSHKKGHKLANAWNNKKAMDLVRRRTQRAAFKSLLRRFTVGWASVVARYDHGAANRDRRAIGARK